MAQPLTANEIRTIRRLTNENLINVYIQSKLAILFIFKDFLDL